VGRVNLTKRVRTVDGPRYLPAVIAGNRRVKPHYVVVDAGKPTEREEHHPEGAYYLDWYEGIRRVRLSVGTDRSTPLCSNPGKKRSSTHARTA
jgi:hypothetical protein